MRLLFVFIYILGISNVKSQVNRPFPQHISYHSGTIKPDHLSQKLLDESVITFYNEWKKQYLKKSCNHNEYYIVSEGVKGSCSVSEGQGYGMLIVVYMAGYDPGAKQIYDGLFRY